MSATIIGKIKSPKLKVYEVKWDALKQDFYVSYAGWTYVGKASSASEAMTKAEAWLYEK